MRIRILLIFGVVAVAVAGCGGSAPVPSATAARSALEKSLGAWKAGKPAGSLASEAPAIEFVDFELQAGKVLSDFSLGPESPGQGVQTLTATPTIAGQPGPEEVKYMVLGLDPIRIFREEDYNRAMNMDNAPALPKKARR